MEPTATATREPLEEPGATDFRRVEAGRRSHVGRRDSPWQRRNGRDLHHYTSSIDFVSVGRWWA